MIGNKSEYFLKVLIELARRQGDGYLTSREIAERQGIPPKYIPQIVAELSRAGWVETSRGPKGGIRLAVNPQGITVADVIDLAEGGFAIKSCLVSARPCPLTESCPLYPVWLEAQQAVSGILASYSIADLVDRKWRNGGGRKGEN
ncbi:MAG: hypothetical protein PWQ41_96 [Bacillota bacterium]|jgi:Rrf2 family protein|nr:hypothetical protein [Bacillota bacterium]MDK2924322.1 hypothetical protein [Bacillota bacterium]